MKQATYAVLPLITPWNGDLHRNNEPYYIGNGLSWHELGFSNTVKRTLESRGIRCWVGIIEDFENEES